MNIHSLEMSLKHDLLQQHKHDYGIGPKRIYVKVVKNTVLVIMSGCLTRMEERLIAEGELAKVQQLREFLFAAARMRGALRGLPCEMIHGVITIDPLQHSVYILAVFKDDLEELSPTHPPHPSGLV